MHFLKTTASSIGKELRKSFIFTPSVLVRSYALHNFYYVEMSRPATGMSMMLSLSFRSHSPLGYLYIGFL
jgi:hypothetical protein